MGKFAFWIYHMLMGASPASVPLSISRQIHTYHAELAIPLSLKLQWPGKEEAYNHVLWVGLCPSKIHVLES